MYKKFEMELAGRTLRVDVGRVAKQANGAVLMHYGDTVVLSTANQEKELTSSRSALNTMRSFMQQERSREDLTREKERHQKMLFLPAV